MVLRWRRNPILCDAWQCGGKVPAPAWLERNISRMGQHAIFVNRLGVVLRGEWVVMENLRLTSMSAEDFRTLYEPIQLDGGETQDPAKPAVVAADGVRHQSDKGPSDGCSRLGANVSGQVNKSFFHGIHHGETSCDTLAQQATKVIQPEGGKKS